MLFTYLFNQISKAFNLEINRMWLEDGDKYVHHLFSNSYELFNAIVHLIIREMSTNKELYDFLFNPMYSGSNKKLNDFNITEFKQYLEGQHFLPQIRLIMFQIIKQFRNHEKFTDQDCLRNISVKNCVEWITNTLDFMIGEKQFSIKIPSDIQSIYEIQPKKGVVDNYKGVNSSLLLYGPRGSGKSQIMNYLWIWALQQEDWIAVRVPRSADYTKRPSDSVWHNSGLSIYPDLALDMLNDIVKNQSEKLANFQVKQELYGKYNVGGFHEELDASYRPLPVQHKYLEDLRCWTDDWKKFLSQDALRVLTTDFPHFQLPERIPRIQFEIERIQKYSQFPYLKDLMENPNNFIYDYNWVFDRSLEQSGKKRPKKLKIPKNLMAPNEIYDYLRHKHKTITGFDQDKNLRDEHYDVVLLDPDKTYEEQQKALDLAIKLSNKLPQPKNLLEIAEFALKQHVYGTNAICEIILQLYHSENYKFLFLVDEWNELFKPTNRKSVMYANYKNCNHCVPPYDYAIPRLSMKWDGHRIMNGAKVVASCEQWYERQSFIPKLAGVNDEYSIQIPNLTMNDLRLACYYYMSSGWVSHQINEPAIESMWMQSQGNWYAFHQQAMNFYETEHFNPLPISQKKWPHKPNLKDLI